MMDPDCEFYLCMICFESSDSQSECHGQLMIHCDAINLDAESRKPPVDDEGYLKGRAPIWFLNAQDANKK